MNGNEAKKVFNAVELYIVRPITGMGGVLAAEPLLQSKLVEFDSLADFFRKAKKQKIKNKENKVK